MRCTGCPLENDVSRKSIEIREKRADLIKKARAIFDKCDDESRELTKSEETQYDKLETEVRALDKDIDRLENLEAQERGLREQRNDFLKSRPRFNDAYFDGQRDPVDGSGSISVSSPPSHAFSRLLTAFFSRLLSGGLPRDASGGGGVRRCLRRDRRRWLG